MVSEDWYTNNAAELWKFGDKYFEIFDKYGNLMGAMADIQIYGSCISNIW